MTMPDEPQTNTSVDDLIDFLDASPSPWHAVESTIERLDGFARLDEADAWTEIPDAGYVVRSGAIIAWRLPSGPTPPHAPVRIVGAHTDSPGLRVKPRPDTGGHGWKQLAVEVYGGILNNTWLDRDLAIAGRVIGADGTSHLLNVAEPIARVPQPGGNCASTTCRERRCWEPTTRCSHRAASTTSCRAGRRPVRCTRADRTTTSH